MSIASVVVAVIDLATLRWWRDNSGNGGRLVGCWRGRLEVENDTLTSRLSKRLA
jgi:hypothetical protein